MASNSALDLLKVFMGDLNKQASHSKKAENESGETKPATEGARSSENSSDVKNNVPASVDSQEEGPLSVPGAGEDNPVFSIGTQASSSGEDVPSVSTAPQKDPGTSHPAKTAATKYASVSDLINGANDLTARIAVFAKQSAATPTAGGFVAGKTTATPAKKEKATAVPKVVGSAPATSKVAAAPAAKQAAPAADAGISLEEKAALFDKLAGYIAGQEISDEILAQVMEHAPVVEKKAEANHDAQEAEELVKWAYDESARLYNQADTQTSELLHFLKNFSKQSMDELAALTGGAPAGDPAAAAMAGVDPAAMAGGAPGGAPGVDPAAMAGGAPGAEGQIDPALLEALIMALQQQGVTGDQLGGGAPAAGGDPLAALLGGAGEGAAPEAAPVAAAAGLAEEGSDAAAEDGGSKEEEKEEESSEESEEKEAQQLAKLASAMLPHLVKAAQKKAKK